MPFDESTEYNLKKQKKNAMKQSIGWNYYMKQIVSKKINIRKYKMNAVLFAEC